MIVIREAKIRYRGLVNIGAIGVGSMIEHGPVVSINELPDVLLLCTLYLPIN